MAQEARKRSLTVPAGPQTHYTGSGFVQSRNGRLSAQTSPRCMLPWLCEYVFARWMKTSSSGLMLAPPTCSLPAETGEACSVLLIRHWWSAANMLTCYMLLVRHRAINTPEQMFGCLTFIFSILSLSVSCFSDLRFPVFNTFYLVLRLCESLNFCTHSILHGLLSVLEIKFIALYESLHCCHAC